MYIAPTRSVHCPTSKEVEVSCRISTGRRKSRTFPLCQGCLHRGLLLLCQCNLLSLLEEPHRILRCTRRRHWSMMSLMLSVESSGSTRALLRRRELIASLAPRRYDHTIQILHANSNNVDTRSSSGYLILFSRGLVASPATTRP